MIIDSTHNKLVYRSKSDDDALRSFGLHTRRCDVKYYMEHELSSFEILVCSILSNLPNGEISNSELGYKLGFDIEDNPELGSYYDEAEHNVFNFLIEEPQKWGLIEINDGIVHLTNLGSLSLKRRKKYSFYNANVDVLEWKSLRLQNGENVNDYPFQNELDLCANFCNIKKMPYEDNCIEYLVKDSTDTLSQTIQLQSPCGYKICESEYAKNPFLGIVTIKLIVELYQNSDGEYSLSFQNNGKDCPVLTALYNCNVNSESKDLKVERALYTRLLNDENAILNYSALAPFEDILDIDKIIPDHRIDWHDSALLELITSHCNADDWRSLSKNCDISVLEKDIDKYKESLDWSVLTIRLSDKFIIDNYHKYVWEPQLLTSRVPITPQLIEFVLLNYNFENGKDDGQWDWEEIIPILDFDFIKDNITNIPFDLSDFTHDISEQKNDLIVKYPTASWDWGYITELYPVEFLLDNIQIFAKYISLGKLLDRLFNNASTSELASASESFLDVIKENRETIKTVYSPNTKQYIWSESVISFFEQSKLLDWNSTKYTSGFVRNQSLVWNKEFFISHYQKINNESDVRYICSKITDNCVVDLVSDFSWDWYVLSRNEVVYNDHDFVKEHIGQLDNLVIALNCSSNLIEKYFEILDLNSLMLEDVALQAKTTDSVSVDFIKTHINANWDWRRVTRKVYQNIKIELIGNTIWRDKWDWDFLSQSLDVNSILEYANSYSDKWNWSLVLPRLDINALIVNNQWDDILSILSSKDSSTNEWCYLSQNLPLDFILSEVAYLQNWNWSKVFSRMTETYLLKEETIDSIHNVLVKLDDIESLWGILTAKFSTVNLISVINNYADDSYRWDYSVLYSRPDFDAKKYLDENAELIKWEIFSESEGVNRLFAKSSNKKTRSLWIRIFKDYLNNETYNWDYSKLSHLSNILQEPRLLQLDKEWDWNCISSNAPWINFADGDNYYTKILSKKLNFKLLSSRIDINISEQVIDSYEKKGHKWDWDALTNNESIKYSLKFIEEHIDKKWNWTYISNHPELNNDFVVKFKDKDWDWIQIMHRDFFNPTLEILKYLIGRNVEIDWKSVSANSLLSIDVIEEFENNIDWAVLIRDNTKFLDLTTDMVTFLKKFSTHIVWSQFNDRIGINIPNDLVDNFADKIDWRNTSKSQLIEYTVDFVRSYEHKWYWNELMNNLKFQSDIPAYKVIFKQKVKIKEFLARLHKETDVPYIYHFTHLYNAIDVIKTKKILSRNRAQELGLLRFDSAGSVVLRSSLAHPYARFYFRPCTPTQYYNEALGADSKLGEMGYGRPHYDEWSGEKIFPRVWKSKYPKALSLGLPKCPIPVFFRFEIEEVLSSIPELCYYSDRNMQSNNPHVYKIVDNANSLCVDYLYDTMENAKSRAKSMGGYDATEIDNYMKYSQQEFLVESEFDFSNMKSLKIICYDDQYASLLRNIFKDDEICSKIYSVNELQCYELFENENRSVSLSTQVDTTSLSTNFQDDYYFVIKSNDFSPVKFDFSFADVLSEVPGKELHVRGTIKWENNTCPFDIYFYDPNARTKEWLIYSNSKVQTNKPQKFVLVEKVKNSIDSFLDAIKNLPIVLQESLFYSHMINSYHGIEHTVRVLFLTHLLTENLSLSNLEKKVCYIAAIIHDLGKRSDREGAEHGYNSKELYKNQVADLVEDITMQERLLNAVQFHSVEDKDCPEAIQNDIIWKVLKDADALDRSRFVGKGCDKSYLRLGIYQTQEGQNIIDLASHLPSWSVNIDRVNIYNALLEQVCKYTQYNNI